MARLEQTWHAMWQNVVVNDFLEFQTHMKHIAILET